MSTILSVALQAFYTIYTAVLVYLTQSLALTRDLSRPQLLTAIHDTSGAWNGIGAALLLLWRQTKLTASLGKVLAVATYLLNTMLLHITSSSILQFQTYNTTTVEITSSTHSWPNSTDYAVSWDTISDLVPSVSQLVGISMVGLANDTLYEVIGPNRGVGNVNSSFEPSSGMEKFGDLNSLGPTGQWTIISVPPAWNQVLTVGNPMSLQNDSTITNTVHFLASTGMDINDFLVQQAAIPVTVQYNNYSMTMYSYVIACGASLIARGAVVDAQTGELEELAPLLPTGNVSKSWEILDLSSQNDFAFNDSYYNGTLYPFLSGPSSNSSLPNGSDAVLLANVSGTQRRPSNLMHVHHAYAVHVINSFAAGLFEGIGFQRLPSHVKVTMPIQEVRLNINVLPLSFATAASVIVLVLAVYMTRMDKRAHPLMSNTGILDVLWLSSRLPELTERLAIVEKPSADSLRAAGKFNVCLADSTPSTEDQDGDLENTMKVHDGRGNERGYLVSRSESDRRCYSMIYQKAV
ncbi:hypothetical protein BU15DRAFT_74566 [Melanogaster broomeanus]|nr:hypothetical protein BU15DRAFT_74566 [Melanogaster broomeanus]